MIQKTETIEHKLYNDTLTINFYPKSHRYKNPEEKGWLRSVTSITGIVDKPFLKQWAVDMAIKYLEGFLKYEGAVIGIEELEQARKAWENVSQEAKDIGTDVHDYIQQYISFQLNCTRIPKDYVEKPTPPTDDRAKKWVIAFLKWHKESMIEYLHSEKIIYSKKYNYCGIFDVAYWKDNKFILWDFKTSKSIYEDYINQVVGYVIAYEEEYPKEHFDWVSILRFDKETGDFEEFVLYREDPLFQKAEICFLNCLNLKNTLDDYRKTLKEFYTKKEEK